MTKPTHEISSFSRFFALFKIQYNFNHGHKCSQLSVNEVIISSTHQFFLFLISSALTNYNRFSFHFDSKEIKIIIIRRHLHAIKLNFLMKMRRGKFSEKAITTSWLFTFFIAPDSFLANPLICIYTNKFIRMKIAICRVMMIKLASAQEAHFRYKLIFLPECVLFYRTTKYLFR